MKQKNGRRGGHPVRGQAAETGRACSFAAGSSRLGHSKRPCPRLGAALACGPRRQMRALCRLGFADLLSRRSARPPVHHMCDLLSCYCYTVHPMASMSLWQRTARLHLSPTAAIVGVPWRANALVGAQVADRIADCRGGLHLAIAAQAPSCAAARLCAPRPLSILPYRLTGLQEKGAMLDAAWALVQVSLNGVDASQPNEEGKCFPEVGPHDSRCRLAQREKRGRRPLAARQNRSLARSQAFPAHSGGPPCAGCACASHLPLRCPACSTEDCIPAERALSRHDWLAQHHIDHFTSNCPISPGSE